jgi:hypothetical protein
MNAVLRRIALVPLLALVAVIIALTTVAAPGARAAGTLDDAAAGLRNGPVYVDPRARDQLSAGDASALAQRIERADKPVFVAVLPDSSDVNRATLLQDLRTKVGITGVYAVALGDRFDAGADASVMPRNAVENLTGAVERTDRGDVRAMVTGFADQAVRQAHGDAPAAWDGGADPRTSTGGVSLLVTFAVLAAAVGGTALLVGRRGRQRRAARDRAQLETLRPVVDEDITALGEELGRTALDPNRTGPDPMAPGDAAALPDLRKGGGADGDAVRRDYERALDSYDRAKAAMAAARRPDDVRKVTEAVEDGRFALATLEARRAGRPLPERRPPCFFDPRHGPSVKDVTWAPQGGAERTVPVCAADATRIADGDEPVGREVDTPRGRRPYWEAGPAYGPWAYGYFGGGLLPGLLVGTLLGSMLSAPAYADPGGDFTGGDYSGGDYSGSDYDPGDFGGGGDGGGFGGDGGGFGGGDFGGGGF